MLTATLFHGDNGSQEFWESEDGEVFLFLNHGGKVWMANAGGAMVEDKARTAKEKAKNPAISCCLLTAPSAPALARKLKAARIAAVALDTSKEFRKSGRGMRLVAV